jgi:hypothetical protein
MIVTLNELQTLMRRAALGAGWSYGLASEAAEAAVHLAAIGIDGAGLGLRAILAAPRTAEASWHEGGWHFSAQPVVAAGPSVFELLETAPDQEVQLIDLAEPGLLLGYALCASDAFSTGYHLDFNGHAIDVPKFDASEPLLHARLATRVSIARGTSRVRPQPLSAPRGIDVAEATWDALQAQAAESYVPDSQTSRAFGAGAGLTDTD